MIDIPYKGLALARVRPAPFRPSRRRKRGNRQ